MSGEGTATMSMERLSSSGHEREDRQTKDGISGSRHASRSPVPDRAGGRAPLVSVVIPAYERPYYLERAIGDVLWQAFTDFEVLVVDDGSDSDLCVLLERFEDSRIHCIRHDRNRGASAARNTGLGAARGKYVVFMDSDDRWLPRFLSELTGRFKAPDGNELDLVYCARWYITDETAQRYKVCRVRPLEGSLEEELLDKSWECCPTAFFMLRREFLTKGGVHFDESLESCQDTDFSLRVARRGRVGCIDKALGVYCFHGDGRISTDVDRLARGANTLMEKLEESSPNIRETSFYKALLARREAARGIRAVEKGDWRSVMVGVRRLTYPSVVSMRHLAKLLAYWVLGPSRVMSLQRAWRGLFWMRDSPFSRDAEPEGSRETCYPCGSA